MDEHPAERASMTPEPRGGWAILAGIWLGVVAVSWAVHDRSPLPPHSAHDAFLLVPQLANLLGGAVPDDPSFGMFHPTWFSERAIPYGALGADGFVERIFGNVQDHTWIDAPHPMILMAWVHWLVPMGTLGPLGIQCLYFLVLMVSVFSIGSQVGTARIGLMAAVLVAGTPGLFGAIHYIEPHLAVAAMSAASVALLLRSEGMRRWGWSVAASLCLWSLSRSGEGSGEVVIAGLVVVGPVFATIIGSDRRLHPLRWLVGLCALALPLLLLADLAWMVAAMERVTRAFADPAVQTDVVAKGGWLSTSAAWVMAYGVLSITDYFRPALAVVVGAGVVGALRAGGRGRWLLVAWLVVPWVALSWMQRKASWYGIALLPPAIVWAAMGLDRMLSAKGRAAVWCLALGQFLAFSLVPRDSFPSAIAWFRDPLPLHDWRLRRIEYLQPATSAQGHKRVRRDLDRLVEWAQSTGDDRPIALMTMGTQHDYAARYYLQMARPGVDAVNLGDPRLRAARYRSLHPDDFGAFVFLDQGAEPWPPSAEQRAWLRENLRCEAGDPFDAFVAAVLARAEPSSEAFTRLSPVTSGPLGPGQVWPAVPISGGLCDP